LFPVRRLLAHFRAAGAEELVGAKVALAILSVIPVQQLEMAIAAGDKAVVGQASGVGPKLAARIIAELQGKVGGIMPTPADGQAHAEEAQSAIQEAVQALEALGMERTKAYKYCAKLYQDDNTLGTSELIKRALQKA
ncbi:MAG: Holliday junction branch migration protein RuvA, partial [Pseudomonadota bacterium]